MNISINMEKKKVDSCFGWKEFIGTLGQAIEEGSVDKFALKDRIICKGFAWINIY